MEQIKDVILVVSLLANAGLFCYFVLPLLWKPKV